MNKDLIKNALNSTFSGIDPAISPASVYKGKVRDVLDMDKELMICTSDRISAFDRVLSTIPCKGEVLTRIALFWFENTRDIIRNHVIEAVGARSMYVHKAKALPVEIIVRGYLTGSAWRDYKSGRAVSGITLPAGMKMDQKFATPLITPSTKEEVGTHDQPISCAEIVSSGLVKKEIWEQVEKAALALFARGQEIAAKQGLILVDTKYEMGMIGDELVLIDEVHTPDSSRFWYLDTYQQLFDAQKEQRKLDKEYLRQWLMDKGFSGDGAAPDIPDDVRLEVAYRYIQAFEIITGQEFVPSKLNGDEEAALAIDFIKAKLS